MNFMKLVLVTGMPGCGKEEFVGIAEEKGLHVVRMGDVIRSEAKKKGIELSDANVGGLANDERLKHGYGIWAERTLPYLNKDDEVVIIDGLRCPEELELFRERVENAELILMAIVSSPETRRKRLMRRGRKDDIISQGEFERRDKRELSWGIDKIIALADHILVNEGTVEDLRSNALKFLKAQGLVT